MSEAYWYAAGVAAMAAGSVDWDAHAIKAMLVGSGYVMNQDTHAAPGDVTDEIAATGYAAGGQALTGKTNTRTLNVITLDSADPTWASADLADAYGLVLYDSSTGVLLIYVDFEGPYGQVAGTFTYPVPAEGWATMTAANAPGMP